MSHFLQSRIDGRNRVTARMYCAEPSLPVRNKLPLNRRDPRHLPVPCQHSSLVADISGASPTSNHASSYPGIWVWNGRHRKEIINRSRRDSRKYAYTSNQGKVATHLRRRSEMKMTSGVVFRLASGQIRKNRLTPAEELCST